MTYDATEQGFFLTGEATLTLESGKAVTVGKGDLVLIPPGRCRWEVHRSARRHYRSQALSPACCII